MTLITPIHSIGLKKMEIHNTDSNSDVGILIQQINIENRNEMKQIKSTDVTIILADNFMLNI